MEYREQLSIRIGRRTTEGFPLLIQMRINCHQRGGSFCWMVMRFLSIEI